MLIFLLAMTQWSACSKSERNYFLLGFS